MKYCLLLLLSLSFFQLDAQQLATERWKEITRRTLKGSKEVSFEDTLYLQRPNQQEILLRKGAFMYKGKVDKKKLDMGYITYSIVKDNDEEIQIQDNDYIHVFKKDQKDQSASDAAAKQKEIDLPAEPVKDINYTLLAGEWEAYKRTGKNGPLLKIDYQTLIKTLVFSSEPKDGYYGYITTNFIGGNVLYSIKGKEGSNLLTDNNIHKEARIKVWKLDDQELILEDENGILYYMKRFK